MMNNQDVVQDFQSFFGDLNRLSSIAEWKRMIFKLTDVNETNDFLDYPRNIILVLFATFVITFVILCYQLCIYCPDHDKHRKQQQKQQNSQQSDSNLLDASNTSLHAGEPSIKRSRGNQQPKKRKKSKRKD